MPTEMEGLCRKARLLPADKENICCYEVLKDLSSACKPVITNFLTSLGLGMFTSSLEAV